MSDMIAAETEKLKDKLVVDAKEQLKKISKVKAMTKLAHDLGEDTKMADDLIEIAEKTLKDIVGKIVVKK